MYYSQGTAIFPCSSNLLYRTWCFPRTAETTLVCSRGWWQSVGEGRRFTPVVRQEFWGCWRCWACCRFKLLDFHAEGGCTVVSNFKNSVHVQCSGGWVMRRRRGKAHLEKTSYFERLFLFDVWMLLSIFKFAIVGCKDFRVLFLNPVEGW